MSCWKNNRPSIHRQELLSCIDWERRTGLDWQKLKKDGENGGLEMVIFFEVSAQRKGVILGFNCFKMLLIFLFFFFTLIGCHYCCHSELSLLHVSLISHI